MSRMRKCHQLLSLSPERVVPNARESLPYSSQPQVLRRPMSSELASTRELDLCPAAKGHGWYYAGGCLGLPRACIHEQYACQCACKNKSYVHVFCRAPTAAARAKTFFSPAHVAKAQDKGGRPKSHRLEEGESRGRGSKKEGGSSTDSLATLRKWTTRTCAWLQDPSSSGAVARQNKVRPEDHGSETRTFQAWQVFSRGERPDLWLGPTRDCKAHRFRGRLERVDSPTLLGNQLPAVQEDLRPCH